MGADRWTLLLLATGQHPRFRLEMHGQSNNVPLPLTDDQRAQLGTMPDAALAARIGTSEETIRRRRLEAGIPAFGRLSGKLHPQKFQWEANGLELLGALPDKEIATRLGISTDLVRRERRARNIPRRPRPLPDPKP